MQVKNGLAVVVVALVSSSMIVGCGGSTTKSPETVTVTSSPRSLTPTSTTPPATDVTIPDVVGQNAEIVRKTLEGWG